MENFRQPENESPSMTVKEAAVSLNVSERTVWRMIADDQLTVHRFRRCTRLLRSQVLGLLKGESKVFL